VKGLTNSAKTGLVIFLGCMIVVLGMLFRASLHPDKVIFSNDGPLGVMNAESFAYPQILTGAWFDLSWLGNNGGAASPNITAGLVMLLKPLYYAKFLAPISVLFLGFCAWVFFNRLGLSPGSAVLGGIAMALNSNIFSNVGWGLGSRALTAGMFFLAIAVIIPGPTRLMWARVILCGLCIGMAVMEGADNGVIFSFYLSAYVLFQAWNEPGSPPVRLGKGVMTVAIVAIFAGLIATQSIISLYGVAIKNVAGATANADVVRSKAENWDWATQWSLPKSELLRVIIPGLYGYRMDTENGGNYWGRVGQTPGWPSRPGIPRHSGAGEYAGVLVVLMAIWAIAQARRKESIFTPLERRWIWFWSVAAFISILLAVGRYAPFYRVLYSLPYFSSIRNPMKFMHPCHVSLVILFAYGVQGMIRRYLIASTASVPKARGPAPATTNWWGGLPQFEKRWVIGSVAALAVSLVGWILYGSSKDEVVKHLLSAGFADPALARQIAGFSLGEVGWYLLFLALSVGVTILIVRGTFSGRRAQLGLALLGLLLVADLGRANGFWIVPVNYKRKYASNPLVDTLQPKPYEHRAAMSIGFRLPPEYGTIQSYLHQIYGIEWLQHVFPYYNVQALEVTQLSRKPEDYVQFEDRTFAFREDAASARLQDRHWELTNTRYIIGLAAYEGPLNEVGPGKFRVHSRYEFGLKPGIANLTSLEQLTVQPKPDGSIALFELTTALPRAKLYTEWQVSTNDQDTLRKLADESYDPSNTLLLSESPSSDPPSGTTNAAAGTVETISYAPKRRDLQANVTAPAVLLLNDKYDPDWKVRVDGHPEKLLRANYVMRGVFLKPGRHTVTFSFEPPIRGVYVSLAGIALGVLLSLVLLLAASGARQAKAA
jgi:hypothetical protein